MSNGYKVLLVDDESTVLDVISTWLEEAGYEVQCAEEREAKARFVRTLQALCSLGRQSFPRHQPRFEEQAVCLVSTEKLARPPVREYR